MNSPTVTAAHCRVAGQPSMFPRERKLTTGSEEACPLAKRGRWRAPRRMHHLVSRVAPCLGAACPQRTIWEGSIPGVGPSILCGLESREGNDDDDDDGVVMALKYRGERHMHLATALPQQIAGWLVGWPKPDAACEAATRTTALQVPAIRVGATVSECPFALPHPCVTPPAAGR